jgi:EpsI family protein
LGEKIRPRILVVLLTLGLTAVLIHWPRPDLTGWKGISLHEALSPIDGWRCLASVPLNPEMLKNLQIDDYVNDVFSNGKDEISLYIGYYFTQAKIGASHDPLVCFPGQGWEVTGLRTGKLRLAPGLPAPIRYSRMRVSNGPESQWVIYWFQSFDRATPDAFSQKLVSILQKLLRHREDNAFVRISISGGESPAESEAALLEFVGSFYPKLLAYVKR